MLALALQHWPAIVAAVVAVFGGWKLRQSGVNAERARQAREKLAAAEDRLEMHREATTAGQRAAAMRNDEARKEAMRWAKR